ncbi:hypothetical protein HMPREF9102_1633 [Limosilactobacillus oris F0423]|uniref:Uncharacterized protein n=1 Tax=Limosilactobacillus oris F0423 TaxID=944562 RepID=A0ABP2LAX1_9LACO|nr:hypothetical protein HMPREF9102_1633 [Limosilactobacillus oris F0423]
MTGYRITYPAGSRGWLNASVLTMNPQITIPGEPFAGLPA